MELETKLAIVAEQITAKRERKGGGVGAGSFDWDWLRIVYCA